MKRDSKISFVETLNEKKAGSEILQVVHTYQKNDPVYIGGIVFNSKTEQSRRYIFVPRSMAVYFTEYDLKQISKKISQLNKELL